MVHVLVTVPDLEKSGGVANYYRTLRPYFRSDVEYLTRGSRDRERTRLGEATRLVRDYARFARRLVGSGAADVVHVNTSLGRRGVSRDALFVWASKVLRKPVIVFFRGWDPEFERAFLGRRYRFLRKTFLRADRIIVLAAEFAHRLRAWGYEGEILEESTAVDDALLAGFGEAEILARSERSGVTLLFLARLERDKGIYETLDAFHALHAEHPSLRLLVAGDGTERAPAERYVARAGIRDVTFLGYVRDGRKAEVMRQADVYVFPSTHGEGMPNSVVEAMGFGLPVVSRPIGGIRDIVVHGESGFLYDGSAASDLIPHLRTLIESPDLRLRIGLTNFRLARQRFLASRVVARLETVYHEVGTSASGSSAHLPSRPGAPEEQEPAVPLPERPNGRART